MLISTPAAQRGRLIPEAVQLPQAGAVERAMLRPGELAQRWRVAEKTLERWRREGIGPKYLKLGGRVAYPVEAVLSFERAASRRSTSCAQ